MPGNVFLSSNESNLGKQSVVNLSQIITLDRSFLAQWVGSISSKTMRKVNSGLKLALDLPS
jgi:mRNA interferase MazF